MNIGEYETTTTLKNDTVYQWVEAVERNQNNKFILQIVQPDISQEITATIMSYFDKLQAVRRKGIWIPTQMFSVTEYPLILVYPYISTVPLREALKQIPLDVDALKWWYQASERLHALHNKGIVHGRISLNSFVIAADEHLYLTDFGYAPVLELGLEVLPEYQQILAPEILEQQLVTPAADIYAFAKTVVSCQPELKKSEWYRRATDSNPKSRFQRIRQLFENLKEELSSDSDIEEKNIAKSPKEQESSIIPKYILEVKVEPSEAGKIIGGGSYPATEKVSVKAIPSSGWKFDAWSGDLTGQGNPTTVTMDDNKSAIALFSKLPAKKHFTLTVGVEPEDAGSVRGGGNYEADTQVSVIAQANSKKWRFDHWEGDLCSSENPTQFVIDSHKSVVAHFVKVPNIEKEPTATIPGWANSPQTSEQNVNKPQQKQGPSIPKWALPNSPQAHLDAKQQESETPQTLDSPLDLPSDETDVTQTKKNDQAVLPSSESEQGISYQKTKLGKAFH
ncbi:MAG: protein kinase family protein [Okeania sp. SIO3B3]|nr:protein kinase family protein [Okeania sp. SIO3B3]